MGRSAGGGGGTSLQYSCLENPMDRGTWQAIVYRVAKSQIQLSSLQTWYEFDPGPCYLILLATCSLLSPWLVAFSIVVVGDLVTKSCPTLETSWFIACQAPLSMGFAWPFWPFSSPGHLSNPGIKCASPTLQTVFCIAGRLFNDWATRKDQPSPWKCAQSVFLSFFFFPKASFKVMDQERGCPWPPAQASRASAMATSLHYK